MHALAETLQVPESRMFRARSLALADGTLWVHELLVGGTHVCVHRETSCLTCPYTSPSRVGAKAFLWIRSAHPRCLLSVVTFKNMAKSLWMLAICWLKTNRPQLPKKAVAVATGQRWCQNLAQPLLRALPHFRKQLVGCPCWGLLKQGHLTENCRLYILSPSR